MSPQVQLDMGKLTEFCQRWGVSELALFGSVLREDSRPESDIDVLISFRSDAHRDLFDLVSSDAVKPCAKSYIDEHIIYA